MATVFPKLTPSGYAGDATDFLKTKCDKSGAVRLITGTVSVTSGTTIGTYIGLAPFNKGAKLVTGGSQVWTPQLDSGTALTLSIGYLYSDSSSAGANAASNSSAYASGSSVAQLSGGSLITLNQSTGITATMQGDGWFVVQTGTGSTNTNQAAASVVFGLAVSYDPSGMTNSTA